MRTCAPSAASCAPSVRVRRARTAPRVARAAVRAKAADKDPSRDTSTSERQLGAEKPIDFSVDVAAEFKRGVEFGNDEIKPRFTRRAVEHDRGLPIADALVATSAQVLVALIALAAHSRPSWLIAAPWVPRWRNLPYLIPAVAHGSKMASVWVVGALAGKAYERAAFDGSLREAVKRTAVSGCFAIGLLIIITQVEVAGKFAELDLGDPVLGSSPQGDLILNGAVSELLVDCVSEAVALMSWRIIRWNTSPTDLDSLNK